MTFEQMKARKAELGLTAEMIAEQSGVPLSTVQKIFSGATKAPRKLTIDAICAVLAASPEAGSSRGLSSRHSSYTVPDPKATSLRETQLQYGASPQKNGGNIKRHTVEDYYALPDERRAELIDGVFYDMAAPSLKHQDILLNLAILFKSCINEHNQNWAVYIAPCGVRLDRDNYTMVQPDIFIICGEYDREARCYEGAPDLAVEILSPSTRSRDMLLKLYKYQQAGVREYWIVDPKYKKVTVHLFDTEEYDPKQYAFDSVIPIGISGGKCSIDFSAVR